VVRIGAAPPSLISQINMRFEELDRRRESKIKYEDIVFGLRKKKVQTRFKTMLSKEKFNQINRMHNYAPVDRGQGGGAGSRVHPVDTQTFAGLFEDCSKFHDLKCVSDDTGVEGGVEGGETLGDLEEGHVQPASAGVDDKAEAETYTELTGHKEEGSSDMASFDQIRVLAPQTPSVTFGTRKIFAAVDAMKISAAVKEFEDMIGVRVGEDILLQRCISNSRKAECACDDNGSLAPQESMREIAKQTCDIGCYSRAIGLIAVLMTRVSPYLRDPYLQAFLAWVVWLLSGTLFFKFHTHVGWYKAIFHSVSIGYGIFWIPIDPGPFSHVYIRLHFMVGAAAIGGIMAVFARSLADSKARW
jgi:hypothetical protein